MEVPGPDVVPPVITGEDVAAATAPVDVPAAIAVPPVVVRGRRARKPAKEDAASEAPQANEGVGAGVVDTAGTPASDGDGRRGPLDGSDSEASAMAGALADPDGGGTDDPVAGKQRLSPGEADESAGAAEAGDAPGTTGDTSAADYAPTGDNALADPVWTTVPIG